jgi:hypothetical protein
MELTIGKSVTWGNVVSWAMIIVVSGMGYQKMVSTTEQNAKDVAAAITYAQKVEENTRLMDAQRSSQINSLTVLMAETKITVGYMDKKLDELVKRPPGARTTSN